MMVYAILRPSRTKTEFHGVYATEAYAQTKVDQLNQTYPRGSRFVVCPVTVQKDPAK